MADSVSLMEEACTLIQIITEIKISNMIPFSSHTLYIFSSTEHLFFYFTRLGPGDESKITYYIRVKYNSFV